MPTRLVAVFASSAMAWLIACASAPRADLNGAQRTLARELSIRRSWPEALAAADALCRAKPGDPEGFTLRGIAYREQRLFDEAEADLIHAIELANGHAPAHAALALLYELTGRHGEALEHHRRAATLDGENPSYLNDLGFALLASGRPHEAVEVLRKAVRWAPFDHRIRNNLGFAYAASGDLTQAAGQFERGGTPAEAANNLAWAYERRGALAQAFEAYVRSVRLDPAAAIPRQNLTRIARKLGREAPSDLPPQS